ncbi:MAG: DUF433 domain-containing protein [Planctomycetes bacterium]|nr:DUF433 domain-containing protein [Planctomycetota bacterium]
MAKKKQCRPELVTEDWNGEEYRFYPLGEFIVRAPEICQGRPTFKYSRILVDGILDRVSAGHAILEIARGYDGKVPVEAILEAIGLASSIFIESLPELPVPAHIR